MNPSAIDRIAVHSTHEAAEKIAGIGAVIDGIMCNQHVSLPAIEARFSVDFEAYFGGFRDALAPMVADGLVTLDDSDLRVTPPGRLILRNVAMVFDAYLNAGQPAGYSRTL